MSLIFVGPGGSVERRWIFYALLRDNIEHHLETKGAGPEFPVIHGIGEALSSGSVKVPAGSLRHELERAETLRARPIADLAVSARTVAILSLRFPVSNGETRLATEWPIAIPAAAHATTLDDVFGSLLTDLISVTGGGGAGEVEVIDQ